MFVPRRKHLRASTACYRDGFTFLYVDDVRTSQETHGLLRGQRYLQSVWRRVGQTGFDSGQDLSLLHSIETGWGTHQWVPDALSPGVKSWVVKVTTHLHPVPTSRMLGLDLRLHGTVLN
jgi:hypothetical protein